MNNSKQIREEAARLRDELISHREYLQLMARCGVKRQPTHGWVA